MWLARALLSIYQHFVFTCVSLIGFGAHVEKVLEISSLGFRSPSPGVWFIERMPAVSRLVEGQWRQAPSNCLPSSCLEKTPTGERAVTLWWA